MTKAAPKNRMKKNRTWTILTACLIPPFALLIFVLIAEDWQTRFGVLSGAYKDCKNTHMSGGFVRKTMTLARMSAVTSWMKEVEVYGQDYSLWTNADRKIMRCRKIKGTAFINCIVWASPCRLIYDKKDKKLFVQKNS